MDVDVPMIVAISIGIPCGLLIWTILKTIFFLILGASGTDQLISLVAKSSEANGERLSNIEDRVTDIQDILHTSARGAGY